VRRGFLFSGALALFAFALVIALFAFTHVQTDFGAASMTGYFVEMSRYPSDLANYSCAKRGTTPGNAFQAVTGIYDYTLSKDTTSTRKATKLGQLTLDVEYVKHHPPVPWLEEPGDGDTIAKEDRDAVDISWSYCDADNDEGLLFSILYTTSAACSKDKPASCNWKVLKDYYRFSSSSETVDLTGVCAGVCPKSLRLDAWDGETNGSDYAFNLQWAS
jgi:hypothetical protein